MAQGYERIPLCTSDGVEINLEIDREGVLWHAPLEDGAEGRRKRRAADKFLRNLLKVIRKFGLKPKEVIRNRTRIEGVRL